MHDEQRAHMHDDAPSSPGVQVRRADACPATQGQREALCQTVCACVNMHYAISLVPPHEQGLSYALPPKTAKIARRCRKTMNEIETLPPSPRLTPQDVK